jgi:hypothetical protein
MKNKKILIALPLTILCTQVHAKVEIDFYGFLKASYLHSNNSVSSFGNDSFHAPTEAQNLHVDETTGSQQTASYKQQSKGAFQVAQTRPGIFLKRGEKLSAKIEFDFTDFTATPTGKNDPRVRLAEIYYKFTDNFSARIGQGWTTFEAFTPHTFNYVGRWFRAGSSGFLAQQAEFKYSLSNWNFYGTVAQKGRNISGYPKSNGAATDPLVQDVSSTGLPQVVGKVEYNNGTHHAGVAYTYAKFDYKDSEYVNGAGVSAKGNNTRSYGGKLFYHGKFGNLDIRPEIYSGSNLNDLLYLTLADHTVSAGKNRDIQELGYFTSARYNLESGDYITAGYGRAKITSNLSKIGANKLVANEVIRLGYSHKLEEGLELFAELTNYYSTYTKGAASKQISGSQAGLAEVGMVYTF